MSKRTQEAQKAIASAWEKEKELVSVGKGTRDWTPEQQKDILERGKAYSNDGRAFEGHHMKSVSAFPEYQGNSDNIQFLSREEHSLAHGGSFQNPTNGYYNSISGETIEFNADELIPCKEFSLSNPIREVPSDNAIKKEAPMEGPTNPSASTVHQQAKPSAVATPSHSKGGAILEGIKKAQTVISEFSHAHPIATAVVKYTVYVAAGAAISKGVSGGKSGSGGMRATANSSTGAQGLSSSIISDVVPIVDEALESVERASPIEHAVSGYTKHMNGKEIHVSSYMRGGKK